MANIYIVGDGAIGLLYAHYLANNHTVRLLSKKNSNETCFYQQAQGAKKAIDCQVININDLGNDEQINWLIFAVKAHQVLSAFEQLKPFLSTHCQLVLSHNGMGNVDEINAQLTQSQGLFFLTTQLAGYKNGPHSVLHTGLGSSVLGACNPYAKLQLNKVTELLSAIPLLETHANIQQLRFDKLLVNVAINPLSALYDVKNGQLRAPEFSLQIINLLAEACAIAKAKGLVTNLAKALEKAYHVMALTEQNYSSMHQDFHQQRETEIMAICGYICQQGNLFNIKTPYNHALLNTIRHKKSTI